MKINHICKRFDQLDVLRDVSFTFPAGSTAITGPSGCGKTTLLRILAGLETADSGTIEDVGRVSFIFQEDRLIQHHSVVRNLRLVCRDDDKIAEALAAADLTDFAHTRVSLLSGGMRRRVAFLRGALYDADTLLMDEPFNGVDPRRREILSQWLLRQWQGRRIIVVSHEAEDLARLDCRYTLSLI